MMSARQVYKDVALCIAVPQLAADGTYGVALGVSGTFALPREPMQSVNLTFTISDVVNVFERYYTYHTYYPLAKFITLDETNPDTSEMMAFRDVWSKWKERNIQWLAEQVGALEEAYDPLINNFMKEELTEGNKNAGNTDTESYDEYAETTTYGKIHKRSSQDNTANGDTTRYTYGVGSGTDGSPETRTHPEAPYSVPSGTAGIGTETVPVNGSGVTSWTSGGSVDSDDGSDTKTFDGTHTTEHTFAETAGLAPIGGNPSSNTERYNTTHDQYHTRSGNLGEMTSQAMLKEELEVRKHDLLAEFIAQFIHDECAAAYVW